MPETRTPMDLDEAETLAKDGNVGRVSLALYAEVLRLREENAKLTEERQR
jgi:hypothetical protein